MSASDSAGVITICSDDSPAQYSGEGITPASNTPPGAYDLRVINNANTSAAFRTNVVARKPGIVTADSSGAGLAQATIGGDFGALMRPSNSGKIGSYNTRPANPGERIDFWGTGLGPDLASDTGSFSGDLTGAASIRVILNGTEITPAYAGRSPGYPGLDEIVVVLPSNVTLGCSVSVQIRSGGVLSNQVAISTAAPGASSCLVLPSGVWRCAVGVSPFFTYYDMTVNGLDYVLKTAAGSPTGQYQAGTNRTIFGGTPVSFVTGGFGGFVGEYLPKGTPDINRIPTIEHRLWLRPPDAGSYSVICSLP